MSMSLALDWIFLKREAARNEQEFQAALHGAKLKDCQQQDAGLGSLAGMFGNKVKVKRIQVSKEEIERRERNARNKL